MCCGRTEIKWKRHKVMCNKNENNFIEQFYIREWYAERKVCIMRMSNCTLFMTTKPQCMCNHSPASATRFGWIDGCVYAKLFVMYIYQRYMTNGPGGGWEMDLTGRYSPRWRRQSLFSWKCPFITFRAFLNFLWICRLFPRSPDILFASLHTLTTRLHPIEFPHDAIAFIWVFINARRCIRHKQK